MGSPPGQHRHHKARGEIGPGVQNGECWGPEPVPSAEGAEAALIHIRPPGAECLLCPGSGNKARNKTHESFLT